MVPKEEGKSGLVTHTKAAEELNKLLDRQYREKPGEGQLVAWVMGFVPPEILQCFDIYTAYPESYGMMCSLNQATSPFIEYAEEDGFSANICGYLRVALGYARSLAGEGTSQTAALGGMPRPSMLLSLCRHCDPKTKIFEAMRRYLDVPAFIFDTQLPPIEDPRCQDRKACEHYIQHNVEGLKGLVSFLEEQTGKKLDRDQLIEAVRNSIAMWHLFYDIHEMRKNCPCPLPSEDFLLGFMPFATMGGEAEALQFYRNVHQELEERIRSGVSVIPEEKFRLLWLGLAPYFDMELFNYLESLGAVSVVETIHYPSRPRAVDVSNPLRALAERQFWGWDWGESDGSQVKCGLTAGSHVLEMVRDYNVDGVIAYCTTSCRSVSIGHKHMAKVLREQMGLPVLYIESDMADPRSYSPTEVRENIDAFIHRLEGRK